MGRLIGIDLGTTNSVAAIVDGPQPRVLENREARTQTRSVVGLRSQRKKEGGEPQVLVGDAAVDNWPLAPKDTILSIKRLMGRGAADAEVSRLKTTALFSIIEPQHGTKDSVRVVMGGREYSPVEISAMILKKIKDDAEFRLGDAVTHAVITVPAYFTQIQRDATRKAGLLAGMKVIKLLDEPTAAAVAFGVQAQDDQPRTVLVYDLGGGTFDISVLMCAGQVFAPLNLEGDMWLGGDNFDQEIVNYALEHVRTEYGVDPRANMRFMAELKRAAQTVKERLSAAEGADLIVTGLLQDASSNLIDIDLHITRGEFERMIVKYVGNYVECAAGHSNFPSDTACSRCQAPIAGMTALAGTALKLTKRALQHPSVKLRPDQVDYVVMAGNSTTIPLVQRTMEELFGAERVVRKTHPKHSVALGAAIVAAWMGQRLVCQAPDKADPTRECGYVNDDDAVACAQCGRPLGADDDPSRADAPPQTVGGIAPVSYGTQSAGDVFTVFIRKGDPFPTQEPQAQIFRTGVPRQRVVSIPIYGGENFQKASLNEKQGEAFALLPPELPQGTQVRVRLWLDRDGVFNISAHLDSGTNLQPWVIKGEEDARAIELLALMDRSAADGGNLQSVNLAGIDAARERVFGKLRRGDFEGARRDAEDAQAQINAAKAAPVQSLSEQAEMLVRWAAFVIDRYGWSFEQSVLYRWQDMLDALQAALGDFASKPDVYGPQLADAYGALDVAADTVPRPAARLLQIRYAISGRIRPADPGTAGTLLTRLEALENEQRARGVEMPGAIDKLMEETSAALEQIARTVGVECANGHPVPKGERFCPQCREDTWSLAAAPSGGRR